MPGRVDVVSLFPEEFPVPDCMKNISDLPRGIHGAAAAVVPPDSRPLLCGGFDELHQTESDACFVYDYASNTWSETEGRMPTAVNLPGYGYGRSWGLVMIGK